MNTSTNNQTTSPLHQLPASHPAWPVIDQCLEISANTIGFLIDSTSPAEIRAVASNWIVFLIEHAEETAQLMGWVEAWQYFWDPSHDLLRPSIDISAAARLPANHPAWPVLRECQGVALRDLANMQIRGGFAVTKETRSAWLEWLAGHADLLAGLRCWQDCWRMFRDTQF